MGINNFIEELKEKKKMKKWEKFEKDSLNFLEEKFNQYAEFESAGKSDSTVSDIKVKLPSGESFYLEAKLAPAQSGQFVLIGNSTTKKFEYSKDNKDSINEYSKKIIEYMNENFNFFYPPTTRGKEIVFSNSTDTFNNWIINHYNHKNAEFIITTGSILAPIKDFGSLFITKAKYRIKKSGTREIAKKNIDIVKTYLTKNYNCNVIEKEQKIYAIFNTEPSVIYPTINGEEYFLSKISKMEYEVKKRGTTKNPNVIFSVKINKKYQSLKDDDFINFIKNYTKKQNEFEKNNQ